MLVKMWSSCGPSRAPWSPSPPHHHHLSVLLVSLLSALLLNNNRNLVDARDPNSLHIFPEPNGRVGMMNTESKYFQCMGSKHHKLAWLDPNGNEIVNDPNNPIYTILKKNILKLELKSPTKSQSGIYKCVAKDSQNKPMAMTKFELIVYKPTVVQGTSNYHKNEGEQMVMECIANADMKAPVEFTWKFGNFDLSEEPQKYSIKTSESVRSADEKQYISRLVIPRVSKEHDGNYVCEVDTTNEHISDSKELRVSLRVQYKPRFDEKTPRYIWVSEETVQQASGPLVVNISCLVFADPAANISWMQYNNRPVRPNNNGQPSVKISKNDNMSVMTLTYTNYNEIRKPGPNNRLKYTCVAENKLGSASHTFEIKVGRIPDSPQIVSIDYKDGFIELTLNETHVKPPVDIFRLEIADEQAHLFNKSANAKENSNNTYVIQLNLPKGEHKVNIFGHNPVGWSENPNSNYILQVVSGSPPIAGSLGTMALVALVLHLLGKVWLCESTGSL